MYLPTYLPISPRVRSRIIIIIRHAGRENAGLDASRTCRLSFSRARESARPRDRVALWLSSLLLLRCEGQTGVHAHTRKHIPRRWAHQPRTRIIAAVGSQFIKRAGARGQRFCRHICPSLVFNKDNNNNRRSDTACGGGTCKTARTTHAVTYVSVWRGRVCTFGRTRTSRGITHYGD